MEAICLHLCDKFPRPQRDPTYRFRWRLILSDYNNIRQRLLNSEALLEGSSLVLYHINETTLTKWYKDNTRLDEVRTLLQGKTLPGKVSTAPQPLPEAHQLAVSKDVPAEVHVFGEPEDTTEEATVRCTVPIGMCYFQVDNIYC